MPKVTLKPSYVLDAWLVARNEYLEHHAKCCGNYDPTDEDMDTLDLLLVEWERWSKRVDLMFTGVPVRVDENEGY